MFGRVVIKLSGEGLAGDGLSNLNEHFDENVIDRITDEIIRLSSNGVEISIVVGGGNFWRGRDARSGMDRVKAHQIGMLGTIMNGIYLSEAFRIKGADAVVMTPFEAGGFTERFNKEAVLTYFKAGKIVIFAGGTGHPFFSTDSIVAIRACELSVDAVLYAKSIDCVYTKDPNEHKDVRKYKNLSYKTAIAENLAVADIPALYLTSCEDIISLVFALDKPGSIVCACENNGGIYRIGGTVVSNHVEEEFYV